ncbi:cyclopropane-fatty-acyl-phospholipid synthase family protein [Verrucomicrobia bacterium]|nr:cyclopropane-fatty-acyl-phospholipid synthase family protein [Verrucomicrobiota bacterium]
MIDWLLEKNLIPDFLIRQRIRKLNLFRIKSETLNHESGAKERLIEELKTLPVAIETQAANDQHYEVPPDFFEICLGKHLKYSCCYWDEDTKSLDEAEAKMLRLTCERAEIEDGHDILELGCGWGAISLWMAESYPNSRITSVSNSQDQRKFIMNLAKMRGLNNLEVKTCDMNSFETNQNFDRVISVEMFEHMKNYEELLSRVKHWLKPEGKLFVHIFSHINFAYHFETEGSSNWMGRHFFTGGIMPSHDLLSYFNRDLIIDNEWKVNGIHYHKTAEAWLQNMDKNESHIRSVFSETYGKEHTTKWWSYWRIFFMACSELWKTRNGDEWIVSHYLMKIK